MVQEGRAHALVLCRDVRSYVQRCVDRGKDINLASAINKDTITKGLRYSLATGNWGEQGTQGLRAGVSQVTTQATRAPGCCSIALPCMLQVLCLSSCAVCSTQVCCVCRTGLFCPLRLRCNVNRDTGGSQCLPMFRAVCTCAMT